MKGLKSRRLTTVFSPEKEEDSEGSSKAIGASEYHALRIFYTVTLLRNDDILHNFKSNTHLGEKWVSMNETLQLALCLSLEMPTIYAYQRH